ncbi:MAG: hypothetical protein WC865_01375 [Bacteroidales bacterium]
MKTTTGLAGRKELENPNSMNGYHKYFYGPLILGHVGKEEIQIPQNAEFEAIDTESFVVKNSSIRFTPVHHLLNREVKKETGYQIQVLFKNE